MISEQKYYTYLCTQLYESHLDIFRNRANLSLMPHSLPDSILEIIESLNTIESRYEFNMQKMCVLNYNKFVLWQRCFAGKIDEEKIKAATEFVAFCCLADKFLDSGRFDREEKEIVYESLNIRNFQGETSYTGRAFSELDEFINHIRNFLERNQMDHAEEIQCILLRMRAAYESEKYMYLFPLSNDDRISREEYHLLTDKSVQFEIAAFMIASMGYNSEQSLNAANCIGEIFWVLDDLCDLLEDIKNGQKNSLLFYSCDPDENISIKDRAQQTVCHLDQYILILFQNLESLKQLVSEDLLHYIYAEVWDWGYDIRHRVNRS